ncbi:MAG: hypothetical protein AAF066_08665 [Pseudomonadota bacterium]
MLHLESVLRDGLNDPDAGWNMGSLGAIAEFHHVSGDPPAPAVQNLQQRISRGAIRIETLEGVKPVAYETASSRSDRWLQGVALCLPEDQARMNERDALTELGPDTGAIREEDQSSVLFDMGLGQQQLDFCIRTDDPELLGTLRAQEGRSLFDLDNPAMGAILHAHPHRVALTRLGRVEVYQMIGGADTGGKSPEGPHTHVLPRLLRVKRTHAASTPIPDGWTPCCGFHPKSPMMGRLGEEKNFDTAAFDAFQSLLNEWGPTGYVVKKKDVWAALEQSEEPKDIKSRYSLTERSGLRNAIRQWRRLNGDSKIVAMWAQEFDQGEQDTEEENPGH